MRTLAIDYDATWTADVELFAWLARKAQQGLWQVIIVTNRAAHDPVGDVAGLRVIYCAGAPKRAACAAVGLYPDVWVDDMPVLIDFGQAGLERLIAANNG